MFKHSVEEFEDTANDRSRREHVHEDVKPDDDDDDDGVIGKARAFLRRTESNDIGPRGGVITELQ